MGRPRVSVTLSGIQVTALVDTGASRTLLRSDIFRKLNRPFQTTKVIRLQTLTGEDIPTKGEVEVTIDKVGIMPMIVLETMGCDVLIGSDTLEKFHAAIDYENQVVLINGKAFPMKQGKHEVYTPEI